MKRKRLLAIVMVLAFMSTFMVSTTIAAPAEKALECLDDHDGEHEVIVHYDDAALSSGDIDLSWDDNGDEIRQESIILLARWVSTGWFSGYWEPIGTPPDPEYYTTTHFPSWGLLQQYYEYELIQPNPEHVGIFTVDVDESAAASGYRVKNYTVVESVYANHEPNPGSVVSSSTWIESSVPFEITAPCYDSPGKIDWDVTVNLEVEATFVSDDGTSAVWVDQGGTPVAPTISDPFFTGWDPELGPISVPTTFTAQYRDPVPHLTLTKEADPADGVDAGDVVTYTFTITNDGETTVSGITLSDAGVTFADGATDIGDLSPGASAVVTGTYTITETDMFAGEYVNTATATGGYNDETVEATDTVTVDVIDADPSISLVKSTDDVAPDLGETVTYTFTVTNTGNVTLYGVGLEDATAVFAAGDDEIGTMLPGATATRTAERIVTEDDLWTGSMYNQATATGYDQMQSMVTSSSALTIDTADVNPELTMLKEVNTEGGVDLGDTVDYTITVTNSGNVTLFDVTVQDEKAEGLTNEGNIGTMVPGQVAVLYGTYTITEADIWYGLVENTAAGSGLTAEEGVVTAESSTEFNTADINPGVSITKSSDTETAQVLLIGETVTYTFEVTNTGNVTIEEVTITDSAIGYDETVSVDLAPGESVVIALTGSYTIQEIDSFEGSFTNVAQVVGYAGSGEYSSEPADSNEVTVLVQAAEPMISITKEALLEDGPLPAAGDLLSYEITVVNNGNVTIYDIMVEDLMIGLSEGPFTLAPGESQVFTLADVYEVTESDMFIGVVANLAETMGYTETQVMVTDSAIAEVDVEDAAPELTITKTSERPTYYVGEKIEYTITVENTGNVTVYDGDIVDDLLGGIIDSYQSIAPGETISVSGEYVTDENDRPGVTNVAYSYGFVYGGGTGIDFIVVRGPFDGQLEGPSDDLIGPLDGGFRDLVSAMVGDETELFVSVINRPAPKIPGIMVTIVPDSTLVETGTEVVFTITVTNIGTAVLNDVNVVDEDLGVNQTIPMLFVGTNQEITVPMVMEEEGMFETTVTATGSVPGVGSVASTDSTSVEVIADEEIPENPPEEPEVPVIPPEEPVPGDTTENPQTGAIPFGALSASGLIAFGAGVLGLIFRKKEDEE